MHNRDNIDQEIAQRLAALKSRDVPFEAQFPKVPTKPLPHRKEPHRVAAPSPPSPRIASQAPAPVPQPRSYRVPPAYNVPSSELFAKQVPRTASPTQARQPSPPNRSAMLLDRAIKVDGTHSTTFQTQVKQLAEAGQHLKATKASMRNACPTAVARIESMERKFKNRVQAFSSSLERVEAMQRSTQQLQTDLSSPRPKP